MTHSVSNASHAAQNAQASSKSDVQKSRKEKENESLQNAADASIFAQLSHSPSELQVKDTAPKNASNSPQQRVMMSSEQYLLGKEGMSQPHAFPNKGLDSKSISSQLAGNMKGLPPGSQIAFSIILPQQGEINVKAVDYGAHWRIGLTTQNEILKKKLKRSKEELEESATKDLGKKVYIDV